MTTVLQVMTSHDALGETGRQTGYWASELTHAYRVFERAGYQIEFASVEGGNPPLDPLSDPRNENSMNRDDETSVGFYGDPALTDKLAGAERVADLDPTDYDVVYFTGGAGAMWDFPANPDLSAFVREMWEGEKLVAAVCHGVAALCDAMLADGSYLVSGRKLTGFSNAEEHALEQMFNLPKFVPFYLQERLVDRGGDYQERAPFSPHVVADGNLLTGQQPASGQLLAEKIVETLAANH